MGRGRARHSEAGTLAGRVQGTCERAARQACPGGGGSEELRPIVPYDSILWINSPICKMELW